MTAMEERKPANIWFVCWFVCLFFFPKSAPKFVTGADKSKRTRLQLSCSGVLSRPLCTAAAAALGGSWGWGNWFPVLAELGKRRPFPENWGARPCLASSRERGKAGAGAAEPADPAGGPPHRGGCCPPLPWGGPASPSSPPATPRLQGDPRQPQRPACPEGAATHSR